MKKVLLGGKFFFFHTMATSNERRGNMKRSFKLQLQFVSTVQYLFSSSDFLSFAIVTEQLFDSFGPNLQSKLFQGSYS